MNTIFYWLGVITFSLILLILILNFKWIKQTIVNFFIGRGLIKSSKKLASEINDNKLSSETIGEFGAQIFIRFTRLGLLGVLITLIPTILLYQQNKLLNVQNEKFELQNKKIDFQNNLILDQSNLFEASRISSYNFRLSSIFDKIDEEIKEQNRKGIKSNYSLSDFLVSRIIAIIMAFEPYYMLNEDKLTSRELSPERGQLIVALSRLNLNYATMNSILSTPFKNSDLSGAQLEGAQLPGVDLQMSYIVAVDLRNSNLSNSNLMGSTIISTNMAGINLEKSHLVGLDTKGIGINLEKSNLRQVNFIGVDLSNSNFRNADLTEAKINHAKFVNADFEGTKITADQLLTVETLFEVKNLNDSLRLIILEKNPNLFEEYKEEEYLFEHERPAPLWAK